MLFLLFLVIIFSIPAVQTKLASIVTKNINEDFGTDIIIKKVDLSLLGTVALKEIEIRDHHKDTLIFVDRLRTSLLNAKRVLDNQVDLGSVSMKGINFHLKTYKGEEDDNLTVFTDKFEDNNPRDSTSNVFLLRTSNIYLENLNFRQENENDKVSLAFAAYNGGGNLQDFKIEGPNVSTQIRGLYFTDNRGVEVTSLKTDFAYSKEAMLFKNTIVKTPHSYLKAEIRFDYKRENLGNFNELVELDAVFDKSYLSVLDLKKLYNELNGNDVLHFTTKLHGSLNNFSATKLRLNSDKGIKIYGDLNFINAVSQEDFFFTGDLEYVTADYFKLKNILPNLLGKTLPTEFRRLGAFSLSGFTKLTPRDIEATLDIDSEVGSFVTDLEIENFDDIDEATYEGEIELLDFNVGKFFNDPLFGNITFKGEVIEGKGFRIDNINTTLLGEVSKLEFNGYEYQNISVNGNYANNLFDGKLDVNDPNLKMKFDGLADISDDVNQFDFNANITYADLRETNLYTRDSISELEGVIDLDISGNTLNDMVGVANFKNIKYKNQKDTYPFKQFLIFSTKKDGIKNIRIDSEDIVKGELKGDFKFEELLSITQNALGSIYSNYNPYKVEPHQFLNFDFTIYNQIVEIFFPEVSIAPNTTIKGRIKADNDHLKLTVSSPRITAYGNTIDTLLLRTDNKNPRLPYDSFLTAKNVSTPYYNLKKLNLVNIRQNDTLYFKSTFLGGDLSKEDFNMDFYFTINEAKKSVLGIQKSNFNFKNNDWSINPEDNKDNKVVFDFKTDEYVFSPFLLKSKDQEIKFKGVLRDSTYKSLQAEFKKVSLESFLPEVDSLSLQGQLSGIIDFAQRDSLLSPKGTLTVKDFQINDFKQGDLALNVEGENSYEKYKVDFSLERERVKSIDATGELDFSKSRPEIDLQVFMKDFELNAFSPLGEDVLSSVRGSASGDFTLKGFLRNPNMDGSLVLKDAGLKFPYLNVDYDFDGDATIGLNNQSFEFNNIGLRDTKHQTIGTLNGAITHQNFNLWSLNLEIDSENLLVLDTQDSEEALYYGTGFISGNAGIYGLTSNIIINVNAKTMPNTLFVIPLKDIASVDTYRLIHFKSEKKAEDLQKELAIEAIEGVDLDINLEVTKDAIAQVVIDEENGSELRGSGTGDLQIEINTRGKFNMFGDFTIDNGFYNLKYGGIIDKPFKILSGGTISWDGNPYEANLNVTAVYTTRANPAVLLENFNSNRDVDVELITKISGSLFNSTQEFDIQIPNTESTINSELDFVLNDNDINSKMRQFASLLALGSFTSPENARIDGVDLLTGTTSNIVGSLLSDIISSNTLKVGIDYSGSSTQNPESAINQRNQVGLTVSTNLSKNVIINGKVGVPVGTQTQSSVVGEVKVEVLLNESGNFRGVIFNRQNEIQYSAQEEGYTQGIGLSYQVNFNTLSELLQKIGLKKKDGKKKTKKKKDSILTRHKKLINFKEN
ncbi:translocation/assembly module TamB domain-containing protein [Pseudotenacibaculum sp. MALMAid0570]|uniref:translocation/assembly module TamB domain-containing protein n=1 Tax=Pseudotenacibaculum sp. MALMAid0570 TaxID=3143938 RepID=UPI0032DEC9E4